MPLDKVTCCQYMSPKQRRTQLEGFIRDETVEKISTLAAVQKTFKKY